MEADSLLTVNTVKGVSREANGVAGSLAGYTHLLDVENKFSIFKSLSREGTSK